MKFRIKADATFEAEDIANAFSALCMHFHNLSMDESSDLIESGSISIEPLDSKADLDKSTQMSY